MKSNGFTMIELLAIIVIIGLVATLAIPNILGSSNKVKTDMYCEKIKFIETGAILWGEDNYATVSDTLNGYTISISELLKTNYLTSETEVGETEDIFDPRENTSLKNREIKVFISNKRVYAEYILNSDEEGLCD